MTLRGKHALITGSSRGIGRGIAFYQPPMDLTLDQLRTALDSQAQAFLLEAQLGSRIMPDGGRIIAISYSPSGLTGKLAALGRNGCR